MCELPDIAMEVADRLHALRDYSHDDNASLERRSTRMSSGEALQILTLRNAARACHDRREPCFNHSLACAGVIVGSPPSFAIAQSSFTASLCFFSVARVDIFNLWCSNVARSASAAERGAFCSFLPCNWVSALRLALAACVSQVRVAVGSTYGWPSDCIVLRIVFSASCSGVPSWVPLSSHSASAEACLSKCLSA